MTDLATTPVIFDTDGGVDDCLALWFGLESPHIDVVAVTCVGGVVSAAQAARNVAKVLVAAGHPEVPIAVGADGRFGPAPDIPTTERIHGHDGLGDAGIPDVVLEPVAEPAVELLVRLAHSRPGELTLVAVGPFTNVACALRAEPTLASLLGDLVVMGGVVYPPGNAMPLGEFNAVFDPAATAAMVSGAWAHPPSMVGLDVTRRATLSDTEFAVIAEGRTAAARFMAKPLEFYRNFVRRQVPDGNCSAHDLLALMSVVHPGLIHWEALPLTVDTGGGAAWGTTVADLRMGIAIDAGSVWHVGLDVDVDLFRREVSTLLGG